MSTASSTSIHSRRLSKEGSINGSQRQSAHSGGRPPPENDTVTVGPTKDEQENRGSSVVKLPSRNSDTPSQPSELQGQENPVAAAPDGGLAPEAEKITVQKDQPNPSDLMDVMKEVLDVLRDSTIASKGGKDDRSRFWGVYRRVAEEHDGEFLERYTSDMDIVLVFSGLFSAVSTSFIVAMESNLSSDPSDTTNALLTQLVQLGLGNLTAAGSTPATPASTWSPAMSDVRIQTIAYASLSMSLLAAFGAVLGKQWLGYYKSNRYGRGSQEERGKRRQEKYDGIITWYFDAVVQSFPILLQISLLLFGIALGANLWYKQYSIAWVVIGTTVFGFLFYSLTVMASLVSPACPFQTPISAILRVLRIDRVLCPIVKLAYKYVQQLTLLVCGALQWLLDTLRSGWTYVSKTLTDPVCAVRSFARRSLRPLFGALNKLISSLRSWLLHSPTKVADSEAQSLDQNPDVPANNQRPVDLELKDIPTSRLDAPSIKWLLETSTDPEVFLAAATLVPRVEWPLDLDISYMLHQLYDIYTSCLDFQKEIVPSLKEKASACTMALSHLYCGRVLQEYPIHGEFLIQESRDFEVLEQMWLKCAAKDRQVLATAAKLSSAGNDPLWWFDSCLQARPDSVPEWLSHFLPYHFVTGRVDEKVENLAIAVISKLLSSPSSTFSPSTQIIANCTLLASVMVGVRFDKKDIGRIDKSSALPQLAESLWVQFQKALWACDGGNFDRDSTGDGCRAWKLLGVICRMLELAPPSTHSFQLMRNLDAGKKFYSRVRPSEQRDPSVSWATLQNLLHFTFAAAKVSQYSSELWTKEFELKGNSHLPDDFDWLIDTLDYVHSDDHKTAGDILLLLCSWGVSCSPAKQHLFIKSLIACMGSSMPPRLRHAALRAAHSAWEVLASINAIDDAKLREMVLTKFSPAVLTAVCLRPGATPADYGTDCFFDDDRDLCYLELVFALARNSYWRPHLCGDGHVDRCISIIARCKRRRHSFYLAGIFLRIAPEQSSITSLESITEQQWWGVMLDAWGYASYIIKGDIHCLEFLPVLVEGTKKYMEIASKSDLEQLIKGVDFVLNILEEPGAEHGEGVAAAVELRTVAGDKLETFSQ